MKKTEKKEGKNIYHTYIKIAQLCESLYIHLNETQLKLTSTRKRTLNTKFMDNKYIYEHTHWLLIVLYRYKTIPNKKLSLSQSKINFSFYSLQIHINQAAEFLFGHGTDKWSIFFLSLQIRRQYECQCLPCRPQTLTRTPS